MFNTGSDHQPNDSASISMRAWMYLGAVVLGFALNGIADNDTRTLGNTAKTDAPQHSDRRAETPTGAPTLSTGKLGASVKSAEASLMMSTTSDSVRRSLARAQ